MGKINDGLYSSSTDNWGTPQLLFDELNKEFHFTLDPCANEINHKCEKYFTVEDNGLIKSWEGERVFCNPPYGREMYKWVKKAYEENEKGTFVVMLLPARTDTRWFHDFLYKNFEIRFIKGRLKFNDGKEDAPFPSMIVVMNIQGG